MRIMAIYHFSAQVISRGRGQSAVASAAYRSGDRLTDERTGEEKFYRRDVEPHTMILAPSNSPEWVKNRECLWNEVEQIEKRKDAQLAREINIALPVELSNDLQKELIHNYIQKEFVDKGMIADIAIHRDDQENPHAHVMLTTRTITSDGFGPKNRDWNNKELLIQWREEWSTHANKALEREGVQDRISHLSNADRGLEQLPTIHLGHVAHEMEKRGSATDRGNINRDRQEYNRLVVDLEKYRAEKKALVQEKARKQAENKKLESITNPSERVHLQTAAKLLKGKLDLSSIAEKYEDIKKREKQISKNIQSFLSKDKKIQEASSYFQSINLSIIEKQEAEEQIDSIFWGNPFQLKGNLKTQKEAKNTIRAATKNHAFFDEELNRHRKELHFNTEKEFNHLKMQHEENRSELLDKQNIIQQQNQNEREVLQQTEIILKNVFIRQLASNYPAHPEMVYMNYSKAAELKQYNKEQGKTIPIKLIQQTTIHKKQEIKRLEGEISRINQYRSRLSHASEYLANYEKYNDIVEKYKDNPYLKNKINHFESTKLQYDNAINARDNNQDLMEKEGVTGRSDFEKQTNTLAKMEPRIPVFKEHIQSHQKMLGVLNSILNGIEQAGREMQWQQEQQKQKTRSHKKNKNLNQSHEMEM